MAIRNDGDWEGWLKFFTRGVDKVSREATETARTILKLREEHRQTIATKLGGSANGLHLLDVLFEQPMVTIRAVEQRLSCVYVTASKLVDQFVRLGLLKEITGFQRNRRFSYEPYLSLFEPPGRIEKRESGEEIQTTDAGGGQGDPGAGERE